MGTTSCEKKSVVYVSWDEVFVSNDKGRREVHYLLKRRGGGSDLAVLGKEKSLKHMSYRYAIRNTSSFRPYFKLRSRREVVNWLDSIVSGSRFRPKILIHLHLIFFIVIEK